MPQRNISSSQIGQTYYQTGRYFSGLSGDGTITNVNLGAGEIRYAPIAIYTPTKFDRITCNVTTGQSGGEARLGIRNSLNGLPSTLILDAGIIDCSSFGSKEAIINQILLPGQYWLMLLNKINATSFSCFSSSPLSGAVIGQASVSNAFQGGYIITGITYGTFSNAAEGGVVAGNTYSPLISLRMA